MIIFCYFRYLKKLKIYSFRFAGKQSFIHLANNMYLLKRKERGKNYRYNFVRRFYQLFLMTQCIYSEKFTV